MSKPTRNLYADAPLDGSPPRESCWHPGGVEGSTPSYEGGGVRSEYANRVSPKSAIADDLRRELGLQDSCWHVGGVAPQRRPVTAEGEIARIRDAAEGEGRRDNRETYVGIMVGFYAPSGLGDTYVKR